MEVDPITDCGSRSLGFGLHAGGAALIYLPTPRLTPTPFFIIFPSENDPEVGRVSRHWVSPLGLLDGPQCPDHDPIMGHSTPTAVLLRGMRPTVTA